VILNNDLSLSNFFYQRTHYVVTLQWRFAYFSQSISEAHEASAQEGDTAVSIS